MYNRRKEAETLFSEKKRKKKVKGIVRSGIAPCWGVFDLCWAIIALHLETLTILISMLVRYSIYSFLC